MKYTYEYRTTDNVRHTGVVVASDREAAFQALKAKGIRPGKLAEAPGFLNKLFGKGKRWLAIGVLAALLVAVAVALLREERAERYAAEDRAQVFGDPAVIQKLAHSGWRETFPDEGEGWLARHAVPGKACGCPKAGLWRDKVAAALLARKDKPLAVVAADPDELKKMKRIVNGMKREFADYAETPSDALDYMSRACERCRVEKGIYDNIAREIAQFERRLEDPKADRAKILADWDKKNATLRSLGLPTVPQPE